MADEKTTGDQLTSPGNEMTDRELLIYVAGELENLAERLEKRLDHADELYHELDRKLATVADALEKYRPLLEKFANPGGAALEFLTGHRKPRERK